MAITINTQPDALNNRSEWNVTTNLVEDASHVNLRIKCIVQNTAGTINYATIYQSKGLDDIDFTSIIYCLFSYDEIAFEQIILQTPNNNSFFDYKIYFQEVYENASGVYQTGANTTSSNKRIVKIEINQYSGLIFKDFILENPSTDKDYSIFLTNNLNDRIIYKSNNLTQEIYNHAPAGYDGGGFKSVNIINNNIIYATSTTSGTSGERYIYSNTIYLQANRQYYLTFFYYNLSDSDPYIKLMNTNINEDLSNDYQVNEGFNCIEIIARKSGEQKLIIFNLNNTRTVFYMYSIIFQEYSIAFNYLAFLTDETNIFTYIEPYNSAGIALNPYYLEDGNNLCTDITNNNYTALVKEQNTIRQWYNTSGGSVNAYTNNFGAVAEGDLFTIEIYYSHNSGEYPSIRFYFTSAMETPISDSYQLINGYQKLSLKITVAKSTSYLHFYNTIDMLANGMLILIYKINGTITDNRAIIPVTAQLYRQEYYKAYISCRMNISNVYKQNTSKILYEIKHQSLKNKIILEWLNDKGVFDCFAFTGNYDENKKITKDIYKTSEDEQKITNVEKKGEITCYTPYLDTITYEWLSEILESKQVNWIKGFNRISVSIDSNSVLIKEKDELIQFSLTFIYK